MEIRSALRYEFDHTTLIARDDPQRDLFRNARRAGRHRPAALDNTSMEGSAAWVIDTAERIVGLATGGQVWVARIVACESRNNVVTLTAGAVTAPGWA